MSCSRGGITTCLLLVVSNAFGHAGSGNFDHIAFKSDSNDPHLAIILLNPGASRCLNMPASRVPANTSGLRRIQQSRSHCGNLKTSGRWCVAYGIRSLRVTLFMKSIPSGGDSRRNVCLPDRNSISFSEIATVRRQPRARINGRLYDFHYGHSHTTGFRAGAGYRIVVEPI